jgi:hypothetical protein
MNLKSMSLDRLVGLRNEVNAALSAKVIDQRRSIESELSKLTRFQGGAGRAKLALGRGGARGPSHPSTAIPKIPPRHGPGAD